MSSTKTIQRRWTRKIESIKAQATACKYFSISNGFVGQPTDPAAAFSDFEQYPHAKLTVDEPGRRFRVTFDSNHWYAGDLG